MLIKLKGADDVAMYVAWNKVTSIRPHVIEVGSPTGAAITLDCGARHYVRESITQVAERIEAGYSTSIATSARVAYTVAKKMAEQDSGI